MKLYAILIMLIAIVVLILFQLEYTKPFINTNIINLDRSPMRLYSTSLQLFLNGIQFKRFSAVDGKTHTFTHSHLSMFSGLINDKKEKISGQKLKNVMSCALSHINIWKENLDNGPVLILEDDVIIYPKFKFNVISIINTINNIDPEWHIIWVSGGDPGDREVVTAVNNLNIYRMNPPEYIGQGSIGYILSNKGLNYFVDNLHKNGCSNGIDIHLLKTLDVKHAYGIHKSLVGSGIFSSSITN